MEIKEFAEKVCKAVQRQLGREYQVELQEIRKNNGIVLHGLIILSQGQNVAPAIYLDGFLEKYESGTAFAAVIRKLLSLYWKKAPRNRIDINFFDSFEKVKDRICYRLIGRKRNEELLEEIPHIEFLDLAICFYYAYSGEMLGEGTIPIYNSHLEKWETSTAELYRLAEENTPRIFPWICGSVGSMLDWEEEEETLLREIPMKILTNNRRTQGAAAMIYRDVLEAATEEGPGGYYIFPSSVHEVILVADIGMGTAEEFKQMIVDINDAELVPEEVLSDSLYYYDTNQKRIKIIF
jgi:hypothetical protein